jgi:hypothetical protein
MVWANHTPEYDMRYLTLTLLVCLFALSAPFGHRPGLRHLDGASALFSYQRSERADTDRLRPGRMARFDAPEGDAPRAPVQVVTEYSF